MKWKNKSPLNSEKCAKKMTFFAQVEPPWCVFTQLMHVIQFEWIEDLQSKINYFHFFQMIWKKSVVYLFLKIIYLNINKVLRI
jgi:hypothetical protein